MYTTEYAEFVATFARVLGDPALPHLFFVEGGALAVENALKVAFDWKSRQNEAAGRGPELGTQDPAPDPGRSTDAAATPCRSPTPTRSRPTRFPKFDWPRIDVPAIVFPLGEHSTRSRPPSSVRWRRRSAAFDAHPHDIAGFIAEPIQGEGGDNHLRPEFLRAHARSCAMSTTRCSSSTRCRPASASPGHPWAYQQLGVAARRGRLRQEDPARRGHGRRPGRRGARQRLRGLAAGSTPPGAAVWSTWSAAAGLLEIIETDGLIEAAGPQGRRTAGRQARVDRRGDRPAGQRTGPGAVRAPSTCRTPGSGTGWSPTCGGRSGSSCCPAASGRFASGRLCRSARMRSTRRCRPLAGPLGGSRRCRA